MLENLLMNAKKYIKKGGEYKIIDFIKQNNTSFYYPIDYEDNISYGLEEGDAGLFVWKRCISTSRNKNKRKKFKGCMGCKKAIYDEDKMMFENYEELNNGFTKWVITSVKSALKK